MATDDLASQGCRGFVTCSVALGDVVVSHDGEGRKRESESIRQRRSRVKWCQIAEMMSSRVKSG